jgi:hypothetical protein
MDVDVFHTLYYILYSIVQKPIFLNVKTCMKKLEFLILKSMHHAIIVILILERVYNVTFPVSDLYTALLTALGIF